MDTDYEETDDFETVGALTMRDLFDLIGHFLYQLGVAAIGFGLVVLGASALAKWFLIPVLRAKGWCV